MNYIGVDNLEWISLAKNYNLSLSRIIKHIISFDMLVLDFGAGSGEFCIPLRDENFNIHALEVDQNQQLKLIKNRIVTFGSLNELDNFRYDCIYSLNVLEHIKEDTEVLTMLKKKLKPGGILLLYLPAFNILYSSMDRKVGHFRRYTIKKIKAQLISTGYRIQDIRYFDSMGFFGTLLFKIFDTGKGKTSDTSLILFDKFIFPLNKITDYLLHRVFGKSIIAVSISI